MGWILFPIVYPANKKSVELSRPMQYTPIGHGEGYDDEGHWSAIRNG